MSARSTSTLEPACSRSSTRAPISIASATTRAGSSPASIARPTSSAATGSSTTTFSTIRRPTSAWTRVGRRGVAASMGARRRLRRSADVEAAQPLGLLGLDVERVDLRVAGPGARRSPPAPPRRPAGPRRPPRPSRRRSCAPSRRRRGALPRGGCCRGRRRPARARWRGPGGGRVTRSCHGYGRSMAATGAHDRRSPASSRRPGASPAPATAAARLREVLAGPPLRHGRDELAKPRSGYDVAGRGRRSPPRTACCSRPRPPPPGCARTPRRPASASGCWSPPPSPRSSTSPVRGRPRPPPTSRCARARARAACCSPIPARSSPPSSRSSPRWSSRSTPARHRPPARRRARAPARRARRPPGCASRSAPGTRCASPRPMRGWAATLERRAARGGAAGDPRRRPAPAPPCARTRTPIRPAASPAGSSSGSTAWASGAATTRTSPTSRAASRATSARSPRTPARRCSTPGLLAEKPSVGQRHVFLNPRRARDIRAFIETRRRAGGAAPAATVRGCAPCRSPGRSPPRSRPSPRRSPRSTKAGIVRPSRPDRLLAHGVALVRWGPTPAAGYTVSATRYPDEVGIVDEAGTLTFREIHQRTNALANAWRRTGHRARGRRRDHVPQPPRLHRGGRGVLEARRQRPVPQHRLLQAAADRRARARAAGRARLRPGVRRAARARPTSSSSATSRGTSPTSSPATSALEDLVAGGDSVEPQPAAGARQGDDPHLGHDRHAEGRQPLAAQVDGPDRRAAGPDPAEGARDHDDRRAAVPLLGLRALEPRASRWPRRSCSSASSTPRRRCR